MIRSLALRMRSVQACDGARVERKTVDATLVVAVVKVV